jgi:glycosyltransferase involved in cell wall biosynthesis
MSSIVCCLDYTDANSTWIIRNLDDTGIDFTITRCAPKNKLEKNVRFLNVARVRAAFETAVSARRTNAIALIALGPTSAAWCAIFCRLFGLKIEIIAHGFNFAALPKGIKQFVFAIALKKISRFVVFSTIEREIYSRVFGIPIGHFDFIFWGTHPPKAKDLSLPFIPGDYISVIGGNARDFEVLLNAARLAPELRFILVVRPESLKAFHIPTNVDVYVNLPFNVTMNVLQHSRFMVLPLLTSSVPCGHVTIVSAMHLGKAIIVTGSAGVRDYIQDEVTGLTVNVGDVDDLTFAIRRLMNDIKLCHRLGQAAKEFASSRCTEETTINYFRTLCVDLATKPYDS